MGGDCSTRWPTVAGKFGVGIANDRDDRLLQFCAINHLAILNTLYKQKSKSRLFTWVSPDGSTRNQIDYIILPKDHLKVAQNCRVYNSADIGTDHSLLMAKICIKSKKKHNRKADIKRFDVGRLKDPITAEVFKQSVGGRFEPLLHLDADIDELYTQFKTVTNDVTKEVVGLRRRKNVEGLSQEETVLCEKRREARKEMLKDPSNSGNRQRYSELNREVKNAVKQVKRRKFEEKVKFLEDQFRKHDSHNLFKTVKELEVSLRRNSM